jgi:hypothetical protein
VKDLLEKAGMKDANGKFTPSQRGRRRIEEEHPLELLIEEEAYNYRSIVGGLRYVSTTSRLDITYAVAKLSRHMKVPEGCHLDQAKSLLRCLLTTKDFDLRLGRSEGADDLIGYVDADYANKKIRRSICGYAFFSGGSLISWRLKRETAVARSTLEAE